MKNSKPTVAILDMNSDHPNQGMRGILEILDGFTDLLSYKVFDVRVKNEIPDLGFDIYISSGGPGHPLEKEGDWQPNFYGLIDKILANNQDPANPRKFAFFICHSFQMVCNHFELGTISKRNSPSFGVYPTHKTSEGKKDNLFKNLPDPFYIVDSRDYQLVQPNLSVFEEHGAHILSLEKIRDHVAYERAIMAVRFSSEMVGVQFHPEADPEGMRTHFAKEKTRKKVIQSYGEKKYLKMMDHLDDTDNIKLTHNVLLPEFIQESLNSLRPEFDFIAD